MYSGLDLTMSHFHSCHSVSHAWEWSNVLLQLQLQQGGTSGFFLSFLYLMCSRHFPPPQTWWSLLWNELNLASRPMSDIVRMHVHIHCMHMHTYVLTHSCTHVLIIHTYVHSYIRMYVWTSADKGLCAWNTFARCTIFLSQSPWSLPSKDVPKGTTKCPYFVCRCKFYVKRKEHIV